MENPAIQRTVVLLRWMIIAAVVGPACGYVVVLFKKLVLSSWTHLYISGGNYFYLLPIGGAALVSLIYALVPRSEESVPRYVEVIHSDDKRLGSMETIAHFFTSAIILLTGGSGGLVGPMIRVCGGVGQDIGRILPRCITAGTAVRRATICGAAAGVSAILGAPIAGGLFAVELLYADGISYLDVFPAMLSSVGAYIVIYNQPGYEPFLGRFEHPGGMQFHLLPVFFVLAVVVGLYGVLFRSTVRRVHAISTRYIPRVSFRALFGAGLVAMTAMAFGPLGRASLGPGTLFIRQVVQGKLPDVEGMPGPEAEPLLIVTLLVVLALAKLLTTSFTVGSGLTVGLTYPSVLMGAALGAATAQLVQAYQPITYDTSYAFVACGVAAMLTGVMNIPLTATVLVGELFGLDQSFVAIIGSVVAFVVAKPVVIYPYGGGRSITDSVRR